MDIQQVVREVTVRGSVQGMDQIARAYDQVSNSADRAATVTDRTTKAQISAEAAVEKLRLRYQDNYRQQQQLSDAQAIYQRAVDQGRISQSQAAAELANIQTKLGQTTGAQKAMATASQALNLQVAALAGGLGLTGQVLSAFGPWGFAAAVGLGAVQAALSFVSDKAHELAQKAKEVKEFSEATGLTTTQFQALRSEAGKFGIDSETMASGLSKFTAGFEELRNGQGALLTDIRRVNPALADQMQQTTDAATAFTLFGKAVQQTDNIFQRNQLLKAGLGKGSSVFGAFFESGPDVAGLTAAFAAAGKGLDDNLIKKLAQLQIDIDKTRSAANTVFASAFGTSTLEAEKQFANTLLDAAKTFKLIVDYTNGIKFPEAPDWVKTWLALGAKGVSLAVNPLGAAVDLGKLAVGAGARKYDNDNVPKPSDFQSPANSYSNFQGAPSPLTLEAIAEKAKNLVSVLGSAASPAQKLDEQLKALDVTARAAGFSLDSAEVATAKLALRQDSAAATIGARVGALGQAATVTDLLTAKTNALAVANRNGAALTPAEIENQKRLVVEQANGVGAVNAQIDALKIQASTMGMSVGAAAEYTAVETKRLEAIRNGAPLDDKQLAALRDKAKAQGELTQANAQNSAQAQADFAQQTVFLSDTEKQIAAVNFQLHGNAWKDFMNDGLSATMRLTANLDVLTSGLRDVGKAAFSSALQGKLGMDGLVSSLDAVAKKLSDKAFDNLTSLDPDKMVIGAVQAGASAVISLFTGDQKAKQELEKAKQQWAAMGMQITNFNIAAKGFTLGPLTNELQSLYSTSKQLQDAALKAKDAGGAASAANAFNNAVDRIWAEFKNGNAVLTPLQQQIKSVNDEAAGLKDTFAEIGFSGRAGTIDAIVQQQIDVLTKQFNATFITGLTARLNTATGQTFLNDAANLLVQHQQDLTQAGELGNDPTLLAQVASTFHAEAQKIVDDAGLVGSAFTDFTKQFPDLAGVVVQASDDVSAAQKQLQDSLNSSAKSIVDFVNGLFSGSSSTLSPTQQLAAAQLSYNTKLGLANSSDPTVSASAQSTITTDAQNLLTAARAVYASSTGYQAIFQNVTSQLLNLPAVQNTTDPTVQAMRDVLTAINIGNAALNVINATAGGTTSAVNSGNSIATGQLLPAVNAGNASAVASALQAYFNQIDPSGRLSSLIGVATVTKDNTIFITGQNDTQQGALNSNNALTTAGNSTLAAIQGLQATANAQLVLMTAAFDVTNGRLGSAQNVYGNSANVAVATSTTGVVVQNQMVQALNKIVWNTFVIANNTSLTVPQSGGSGPGHLFGTYATGGTIPAHGLGLVSEHLNPTWVRAGSEPITVSPFAPQPTFRPANDNSGASLLAEIRALRKEVEQLRKENNSGNATIANTTADAVKEQTEKLGGKIEDSGKRSAFATTQAGKEKRAA